MGCASGDHATSIRMTNVLPSCHVAITAEQREEIYFGSGPQPFGSNRRKCGRRVQEHADEQRSYHPKNMGHR